MINSLSKLTQNFQEPDMPSSLLDKFIENEPGAVPILLNALNNNDGKLDRELNFNLFDIFINFKAGNLEIVDVCNLFSDSSGNNREFSIASVIDRIKKAN
jgi:hypothetical protein